MADLKRQSDAAWSLGGVGTPAASAEFEALPEPRLVPAPERQTMPEHVRLELPKSLDRDLIDRIRRLEDHSRSDPGEHGIEILERASQAEKDQEKADLKQYSDKFNTTYKTLSSAAGLPPEDLDNFVLPEDKPYPSERAKKAFRQDMESRLKELRTHKLLTLPSRRKAKEEIASAYEEWVSPTETRRQARRTKRSDLSRRQDRHKPGRAKQLDGTTACRRKNA